MALVDQIEFKNFVVAIGDAADPEVFTPKCSLNSSRGLTLSGETVSRNIPDCDDDLLPSATLQYVTAISGELSGSGVLDKGDEKYFSDWLLAGTAKNVRVSIGGTGGTRYSFAAKITNFAVTAETKDVVNAEITLVSHGAITGAVIS